MFVKDGTSFDLNEKKYALLNCKNGIIASILRDFLSVDINPYFAESFIPFRNIVEPMNSGDIAGVHFGNRENDVWQEMFGVEFEFIDYDEDPSQWHDKVTNYLATVGPLLVPHDGYYDINAADKYQLNHTLHNSLIYGYEKEGIYHIADRHIRCDMESDTLYQSVTSIKSKLLGVVQAKNFSGDWDMLAEKTLTKIANSQANESDMQLIEGCIDAIVLDAEAKDGNGKRWKQAHSYIKAVGASREMTARFINSYIENSASNYDLAQLTESLMQSTEDWSVCSALAYKYILVKDRKILDNLRERITGLLLKEREYNTLFTGLMSQV